MITVGIFDDHPFVVKGICAELAHQKDKIELVFSSSDKNELLALVREYVPAVMVMDILANEVSGLELFEVLHEQYPDISVIAYSTLSSPILVENLLTLNVRGYLNKRQPTEELMSAIYKVAAGEISLPEDYRYLQSKYKWTRPALLTDREVEIVNLVGSGLTTTEISAKLDLSPNTVENHRKRIFNKLNVKNVAGMIMESARLGYLK